MELLIKISEEDYINIKNAINSLIEHGVERASMSKVCLAILDGTPLPKGHWILSKDYEGCPVWQCSSCRSKFDDGTKFCPECGADMREVESEEK